MRPGNVEPVSKGPRDRRLDQDFGVLRRVSKTRYDRDTVNRVVSMENADGFGVEGFEASAFQKKVAAHAPYYSTLVTQLRLTDFNPLTVDWTTPVPWGNDPLTCKSEDMSDSSGCMMPLGAGLCARPPPAPPRAHPDMRAPPVQRHCPWLWPVLLGRDVPSRFRTRPPARALRPAPCAPSRLRLLTVAHSVGRWRPSSATSR